MEKYDRLLNEIKDYLKKEEVNGENCKNEVISAYDLYNIMKDELGRLEKISNTSKLEQLFKLYMKSHIFSHYDVIGLEFDINNEYSSICFRFKTSQFDYHRLYIQKDKNSQDIYLREGSNRNKLVLKFVKKYYDLILDTLILYENNKEIRKDLEAILYEKNEFTDNLFKMEMKYEGKGKIKLDIKINDNHPFSSEYQKNYLKKETIFDFVEKHKEEILKRFAIQPYQLIDSYKKIYNIYKNNLSEKGKVKSIKR